MTDHKQVLTTDLTAMRAEAERLLAFERRFGRSSNKLRGQLADLLTRYRDAVDAMQRQEDWWQKISDEAAKHRIFGPAYRGINLLDDILQWLAIRDASPLPAVQEGYVMVPTVPEPARIESMCYRYDHSHGIERFNFNETPEAFERRREANRRQMRQLYEEATGGGFYNDKWTDPLAAAPPKQESAASKESKP